MQAGVKNDNEKLHEKIICICVQLHFKYVVLLT